MAKKHSANPSKTWTPDAPLKLDWDKALQENDPTNPMAEKLDQASNPLFSRGESLKHPRDPANHNTYHRQKKG